jgi:urease accessory protein
MPCLWTDDTEQMGKGSTKVSTLDIFFLAKNGVSRLEHHRFSGLLRASRPVYRRTAYCPEVQMIHLGPGCMDGDRYEQQIYVGESAEADVAYQSFTRVMPGGAGSTHALNIHLKSHSTLRMGPNIVIPFAQSKYISHVDVHFGNGARAFIPEILLTRQNSLEETLDFIRFQSTFRVFRSGEVVMRDCIDVGLESLTCGRGWSTRFVALGSVYLLGLPDGEEPRLQRLCREVTGPGLRAGVSAIDGVGIAMRVVGSTVQDVQRVIDKARYCFETFA